MPFVLFTRDKRGYENTFVMHAARVHGRKRSRLLYWFRTPPGIRVGRSALDVDAIRAIEDSHPDLRFDWNAMLQQRVVKDNAAAPLSTRRDKKPSDTNMSDASARGRETEAVVADADSPEWFGDAARADTAARVSEAVVMEPAERHPALEQVVGAEGVVRLRARFAELQARIAEHGTDPTVTAAECEALQREAEPLDPDSWVTLEEARAGLETFEAAFEALRRKMPARRSRDRRPQSGAPELPENETSSGAEPSGSAG